MLTPKHAKALGDLKLELAALDWEEHRSHRADFMWRSPTGRHAITAIVHPDVTTVRLEGHPLVISIGTKRSARFALMRLFSQLAI